MLGFHELARNDNCNNKSARQTEITRTASKEINIITLTSPHEFAVQLSSSSPPSQSIMSSQTHRSLKHLSLGPLEFLHW